MGQGAIGAPGPGLKPCRGGRGAGARPDPHPPVEPGEGASLKQGPPTNFLHPPKPRCAILTMPDPINHPAHYTEHPSGIECIEVTEHFNFNCGNAIKYIWRADLKHASPLEDLRKAAWYINREIQRLEKA